MESTTRDAKQIFSDALEKYSPDQWAVYLDGACGDDDALRDRVERLLKAHGRADSFLDAEPATVGLEPEEHVGSSVGPYKLLQKIGEGGFGVVYMAEQSKPVRRKLALKVIKPGMDTKEVIARFEAERQALALMDHPNIAKVLDVGTTESGLPYLAMELVKGVKITEYADINHLSTDDRLRLFASVCRAVQHAHQKGVIHRDLKPSNVMVTLHDGKPVVKVIDFGVSKAVSQPLTEKTLFTRYGQVIGTPQYMSPEQAEMSGLDVDTRSDVYSLGVILYELLTGQTPFTSDQIRSAGFDEMRRMIREDEPAKPSNLLQTFDAETATAIANNRSAKPDTLRKVVRGELDWIVMRTLDKDRNRRYDTASGLADDVERYLNDQPVNASPPSLTYSLAKAFRRHRAACLTASAIAAALVIGLCVALAAMRQSQRYAAVADKERVRAIEANENAEVERQRAERLAERAAQQARMSEQTLALVVGILSRSGTNPETGMDYTVHEALAGLASAGTRSTTPASSFETPRSAASSLTVSLPPRAQTILQSGLGNAYLRAGTPERAVAHYEAAVAAYQQLGESDGLAFAKTLRYLGTVRGVPEDIRKAVAIERSKNADQAVCASLTALGNVLLESGKGQYDEAKQVLNEACQLFEPSSDVRLNEIPFIHLARVLRVQGNAEAADQMEARAIDQAVESLGDNRRRWLQLGKTLRDQNQYHESNYALLIADSMWMPNSGDEPAFYLGLNYLDLGDWTRSIRFLRRSIELSRARGDSSRADNSAGYLATALIGTNRNQEAAEILFDFADRERLSNRKLITLMTLALDQPIVQKRLERLRDSLRAKVESQEAASGEITLLARYELNEEKLEQCAELTGRGKMDRGSFEKMLMRQGHFDEANRVADYHHRYRKTYRPTESLGWSNCVIGRTHYHAGDLVKGEHYLREAVEYCAESERSDSSEHNWLRHELGLLLHAQGKTDESKEMFAKVHSALRAARETDRVLWDYYTDRSLEWTSLVLSGQRFDPDALMAEYRTHRTHAQGELYNAVQHWLPSLFLDQAGRPTEAIPHYEAASLKLPLDYRYLPFQYRRDRLVELYQETGQLRRGRDHFAELVERFDSGLPDRHPYRAFARVRLAKLILADESANPREAVALLEESKRVLGLHKIIPQHLHDEVDELLISARDAEEG